MLNQIFEVDPKECKRWKFADRNQFEFGDTNSLAEDIKRHGQIEPVFIRPITEPKFKYEIIAGSRRHQACLNAGLMLKAIICDVTDTEAAIIQAKENSTLSISDYSKGISYAKLQKELNLTQKQLSEIAQCSRKKIQNYLVFDKVDPDIWHAVSNMSKVSSKSAEAIYLISKKSKQHKEAIFEIVDDIRKGAGRRKIEQLVDSIILGKNETDDDQRIESPEGIVYATWKNNKIIFSKHVRFNKQQLTDNLINFFTENASL